MKQVMGYKNISLSSPLQSGSVECHFVLNEADKHLQSWSYWDTASGGILWDGEGNVNIEAVK